MAEQMPPSGTPPVESVPLAGSAGGAEPQIHTIPDSYYGAALKARVPEPGAAPRPEGGIIAPPGKSKTGLLITVAVVLLLLGAGGAFVYFNQELLFSKAPTQPAPVVQQPVVTPPAPTPPQAPDQLAATSTNSQSAALSWVDTASNESGFRIERADEGGAFIGLTNLPPNSSSFLDVSVQPSKVYRYRVIALNQGGESPSNSEVSVAVLDVPPPAPEPAKLPPAGLDTDSDGLTDLEEALYASDAKNPDSDNDGFLDGNEVFHLYNPGGLAPGRLIDAKLVAQVDAPADWSIMIPTTWKAELAGDGASAILTTGRSESFRISIENNPEGKSVLDWYLATHPEADASFVLKYRSKRGYEGIIGADQLTTYLPWGSKIFVVRYDLAEQPFINFRTSYFMMMNGLELRGLPQATTPPPGGSLPFEPAATTTGVVTQPEPVDVPPEENP
ncbi:hypothetical protein KBC59_00375 [Patescibacteria group bacterium]|jgi:hypothetical protein|nr:hypothetical protein [Patescibacteria group bacterium]